MTDSQRVTWTAILATFWGPPSQHLFLKLGHLYFFPFFAKSILSNNCSYFLRVSVWASVWKWGHQEHPLLPRPIKRRNNLWRGRRVKKRRENERKEIFDEKNKTRETSRKVSSLPYQVFRDASFFVFFRQKNLFLMPKTHIFGSLGAPHSHLLLLRNNSSKRS